MKQMTVKKNDAAATVVRRGCLLVVGDADDYSKRVCVSALNMAYICPVQ